MIDPKLLRNETDEVRNALSNRGGKYLSALDDFLNQDKQHRDLLAKVEDLRAKRNASSQAIGKAKASNDNAAMGRLIIEVAELKERLTAHEADLNAIEAKARGGALGLPNLPHESVPLGKTPMDNREVRSGAEPGTPDFKPLDHQALGEKLGILDFAAAAKLSGSRFALWRGAGARLVRAVIAYQLDRHISSGYDEIWPPYLVRPEILEGTGQLPKFEEDLYSVQSGGPDGSSKLYLIPTAEVPLTNLARDEILPAERLPIKWTAYTPCFRQEAGSYGKDVRGLIRNHQFDKVELVWITKPEDSLAALEKLTADAESILKELELPYRVLELCTADLGFASRKTYDLEVWMPAEGKYREISSCSDCGDFQARRMNARFRRSAKDAPEFVHTLNGSGVAVGRLCAAILENGQQGDGSVRIPKALAPFFGADSISAR